MSTPQRAIFREGSAHHYYLEYALDARVDAARVRETIGRVLAIPRAECQMLAAFGREAWERLAPHIELPDFINFHPVLGRSDRTAPGTQRDVLVWLHGPRHDLNLQCARAVHEALQGIASLELELAGFNYLDSRDLGGFIDGSANPRDSAAPVAATVPEGRPGAGGSFVLTQKWVHDLGRFEHLSVTEQEEVIGRTKQDSIELEDAPPTAHVRRTEVEIDGATLEIYRRSAPWGGVRENGLYFLAFSREIMRFAIMLDRMFGLAEDGLVDRLTEFSVPVTGSYWYAPAEEVLGELFRIPPG